MTLNLRKYFSGHPSRTQETVQSFRSNTSHHNEPNVLATHSFIRTRQSYPVHFSTIVPSKLLNTDPRLVSQIIKQGTSLSSSSSAATAFIKSSKNNSSSMIINNPSSLQDHIIRLVFLQYRNETKRVALPSDISLNTIKVLFARAFPDQLSMEYLNNRNVRIYIHDQAKSMFYELEDLNDIRDRSVLRVYDQNNINESYIHKSLLNNTTNTGSITRVNDTTQNKLRFPLHQATVMPTTTLYIDQNNNDNKDNNNNNNNNNGKHAVLSLPSSGNHPEYYDAKTMPIKYLPHEPLVTNALFNKSNQIKLIPEKQRNYESKASASNTLSTYKALSFEAPNYANIIHENTINELKKLKKQIKELRIDFHNLRKMASNQANRAREALREACLRIKRIIVPYTSNNIKECRLQFNRLRLSHDEECYRYDVITLEKDLNLLELEVEELRANVINKRCQVKMSHVDSMALVLSRSSKTVASLRNRFVLLKNALRAIIANEVDIVMKEEKFLREEPERLERALRRCKKLTGLLVTLKRFSG